MKNEERILNLLEGLVIQVDNLNTQFKGLETRFDKLEARFDVLETRFDKLEARFDVLETRFDKLETEVATIKLDVKHLVRVTNEMYRDIGMLDHRTEHLQSKMG